MSIDKYDVLRYAETLSDEDLQLLLEQLILIKNVKYPVVYNNGFISKVPEHEKHTSKKSTEDRMKDFEDFLEKVDDVLIEKGVLVTPPFVPPPPKMVWRGCTCESWWKVVHRKDCKCGGGRFVPEDEL